MAKYLHTQAISAAIVDLIKEAQDRLLIVSPYLKLSDTLRDHFRDKNRDRVMTQVIFGKAELNPDEMKFLHDLDHLHLYFSKNLHAKCYLNEHKMIIASMNLYEFSQVNNREMGVLIDRKLEGDDLVYDDAYKDIQSILRNAEVYSYVPVSKDAPKQKAAKSSSPKPGTSRTKRKAASGQGHCINCGGELKLDPTHPFCRDCYRTWKKDGADELQKMKVCHICGGDHASSLEKPACWECYKANKQLFAESV